MRPAAATQALTRACRHLLPATPPALLLHAHFKQRSTGLRSSSSWRRSLRCSPTPSPGPSVQVRTRHALTLRTRAARLTGQHSAAHSCAAACRVAQPALPLANPGVRTDIHVAGVSGHVQTAPPPAAHVHALLQATASAASTTAPATASSCTARAARARARARQRTRWMTPRWRA